MLVPILLFALGLVLLIKGGDWFVDGATGIAHKFHVPELLIGATVVSIGTTLPEVMVSATSAVGGHGEIAYGNAIGSVICNTALIAALTVAIRPSKVDRKAFRTPVIFFFLAAAIYVVIAYFSGYFSRLTGIILLTIFVVYMVLTVRQALGTPKTNGSGSGEREVGTVSVQRGEESELKAAELSAREGREEQAEDQGRRKQGAAPNQKEQGSVQEKDEEKDEEENDSLVKDLLLLVVGAVLIAFGANLLVDNGTKIATWLGVPESVIALTFVALGTSLPELVTAITSLAKGHGALSLGNIVGANLFNLVLVCGVSITLSPFALPSSKLIGGMNASLVVDIPVMLFVMAFLTIPALVRGKLSRIQGIVLLAVYGAFCVFQFVG